MKVYTISQLATMSGVSVRTLHHYDHIGVLKPSSRTAAGYRLYREPDLLRLQQVLIFKELDLPLSEIRELQGDQGFEQVAALFVTTDRRLSKIQEVQVLLFDDCVQ